MKLIDKDALVEKIKEWTNLLMNEINQKGASQIDKLSLGGRIAELQEVKAFLNTLEVKEVDLEKEINLWFDYGFPNDEELLDYIKETAKHFFELGLKAKGE